MPLLLVFSLVLLLAVLLSALAHRTVLSTAVLFLVAGFLVGDGVLGLVHADAGSAVVATLAELALFAVLFTDGMRVGWADLRSAWRLPGRALGWGLPLTLIVTAVLAHVLVGLPWVEAFLVGAILAPTDPVFAAAIVGNEKVPGRLRQLLNVESGVNDGLALPFVVVLLAVAADSDDLHLATIGWELVLGIAIGIVVPWLAIRLERTRLFAVSPQYAPLNAVAIGLLVLALAETTHGNLFLAAFAAGVTVATVGSKERDAFEQFGDLVAEILKLAALLVFGALLAPSFFASFDWRAWMFAVLALVLARPLALWVSFLGAGLDRREQLAAMWFGPKGFASVVYGLLVVAAAIPAADEVFDLVALTIVLSIVAHSSTDILVARSFDTPETWSSVGATAPTQDQDPADAAERLIAEMSDGELLWLLDGDTPVRAVARLPARIRSGPISAGALPRLGIPGIRFSDGPRGVVMGRSTAFPVTMARAATWDPDLEERVGHAMGLEARAQGANYSGAVCVNLLRHPAWGRAQECYGEDPVLTGRMGAALTRGLRRNVMACVKHFALNSIENARFVVDVEVDEHALHEVYLPGFKAVLDAGADSVMTAYNSVNGRFADQNAVLLTDILRDEWGFEGFVTSDWVWGTHDAIESLEAGMDVEMPLRMHRARHLPAALRDGRIARETVLRSARRILATTLRHLATRDEAEPTSQVVGSLEHRALARTVAARAAVLLRNEFVDGAPTCPARAASPCGPDRSPALPLPPSIRRLAVLGRLATEPNLGDHGSSRVHPPATCSTLDGLREALPGVEIVHTNSEAVARDADAVVIVAGMGSADEGERMMNDDPDALAVFGFPFTLRPVRSLAARLARRAARLAPGGDRRSLTLPARDEELITAVAAANPRTVVVLVGGSAILMESWRHRVPAILLAWYPGMEGGRAIADVLTGAAEPGGRLPMAIPTGAAHLPFFDPDARRITYDAWWGQRKLDRDGHRAAYPFGFGLGYTTFAMELLGEADCVATVRVANTGPRRGSTVVQVYAVDADAPRPVPNLVGFRRVDLDAGARADVAVDLDLTPTRERDPGTRTWIRRPGTWRLVVATHSPVIE